MIIVRSEASASLRRVPIWLMGSNGTSPATGENGGQPQINWLSRGAGTENTAATLSLVSANAGEYYVELSQSNVSCLGIFAVHYRSATAIPNSTYGQVVAFDSGDSTRLGLVSLPNAAAEASGGLITRGTGTGQLNVSAGSVGLLAATHSGVTIQGVSRINSSVTPADAIYSAVTVQVNNIAPGAYSGVTVAINDVAPGSYSGVSFSVTSGAGNAIADAFLLRSIAGNASTGRIVQDAFRAIRNKVAISGSRMTVYSEDDVTSAWTASVTTSTDTSPIASIDPAGP